MSTNLQSHFALRSQRVIAGDEMIAACMDIKNQLIQHTIHHSVITSEAK